MHVIQYHIVSFGADPEFFFSKGGKVIGAEKVLDPKGEGYLTIDGVQGEFNVVPNTCRQSFSTNLSLCFNQLAVALQAKGVTADFSQMVSVTPKEMKSLSKQSQQFGCEPSENAYERTEISVKDASKYMKRSAGGHIHIGHNGDPKLMTAFQNPAKVVRMLDILLGNTCVLIDKDPGNVERRKLYGKAGEYRLPAHGLEYRTLSNFWLRSYQIMSFVLGMARFAVNASLSEEFERDILALVDMDNIRKAIDTNDFDLALKNFMAIAELVQNTSYETSPGTGPLEGIRMERFMYFIERGLDWFSPDVLDHWLTHNYRDRYGWENFLEYIVEPQRVLKTEKPTANVLSAVHTL